MTKNTKTDKQIQDLTDNWKRALADYQNLLRRVDHDKQQFQKMANANIIARLLPSLDILEMAAVHNQDLGVQMAARQFHDALVEEGLELISPKAGDVFDHAFHECTETVPGEPDNTIAELVLKGYKIGDYVLRPARVKVFKSPVKTST
jgi:molecular chaperone GrpE